MQRGHVVLLLMLLSIHGAMAQDAVKVDFGADAKKERSDSKEGLMEVVATGIAADPDKAVQSAFSQAIEQAVGVLVDAETLVQNDQLVRESILTFSRGFVQEFKVISRWEKDGLHYARIRALVKVTELSARLEASDIAVREVPGELLYHQVIHELINEDNAAQMFAKATRDLRIDKLVKVTIVGEPEVVDKDEAVARLRVKLALAPDLEAWAEVRRGLVALLNKIALKTSAFSAGVGRQSKYGWCGLEVANEDILRMRQELTGEGIDVRVFKSMNRRGTETAWQAFRVPEYLREELDLLHNRQLQCNLTVDLLDGGGEVIKRQSRLAGEMLGASRATIAIAARMGDNTYTLSPLFFYTEHRSLNHEQYMPPPLTCEETVAVDLEKLRDVAEVAAYIESTAERDGAPAPAAPGRGSTVPARPRGRDRRRTAEPAAPLGRRRGRSD